MQINKRGVPPFTHNSDFEFKSLFMIIVISPEGAKACKPGALASGKGYTFLTPEGDRNYLSPLRGLRNFFLFTWD